VLRRPVESGQYTSNAYLDFCADHHLRPSVGRTGVCWDNSVAEAFWATLKRECVHGRVFATRAEARRVIFRWIAWYNASRLHSALDYTAPITWEQHTAQEA
jgi:putative transposase